MAAAALSGFGAVDGDLVDKPQADLAAEPASPADYLDWRVQSTVFEQLAAFDWGGRHTLTGDGDAESVFAMRVSANFFDALQVRPALGRAFLAGEDQSGLNSVTEQQA